MIVLTGKETGMTTVRWCATTYPPRPVPGISFNPRNVFCLGAKDSESRTLSVAWPPNADGMPVRFRTWRRHNGPQAQFVTRHPQRRDS